VNDKINKSDTNEETDLQAYQTSRLRDPESLQAATASEPCGATSAKAVAGGQERLRRSKKAPFFPSFFGAAKKEAHRGSGVHTRVVERE